MSWLTSLVPFNDPELTINRDMLWVTIAFGALALVFSIISIVVTFWLSYRERREHYRESIRSNIEYLLKNLKISFDDIGQAIFYKNRLGLKRAIDSFDIYVALTLDALEPKIFAAGHNKFETSIYRKIMEEMMKNSIPLAIDRYNVILNMSKNKLKLPETHQDQITIDRLRQYLNSYNQKLEKKQQLMKIFKNQPQNIWPYTEKELYEFRLLLDEIWAHIIDAYRQHQKEIEENKESGWKGMEKLYDDQEVKFHLFRGTLQSLFLD